MTFAMVLSHGLLGEACKFDASLYLFFDHHVLITGHRQGGQDADYRDDNHQFNQCKTFRMHLISP